jgi:hypothetical protein
VGKKLFKNGKSRYQMRLKLIHLAGQNALSDREHCLTPVHGGSLNTPVGICFGQALAFHKNSFSPFDDLPVFQGLTQRSIFGGEIA